MTIYEINEKILELIDAETGEIKDFEEFEKLAMAKDEKIENTALWIKELSAEAKAIAEEIKNLKERKERAERKAESLKKYIGFVLNGEKFSTSKVAVSFRTTKSVNVSENFVEWAKQYAEDLLTYKEPEASKTAIKQAIEDGREILFAEITENKSVTIK